jgi:hypothetical protein
MRERAVAAQGRVPGLGDGWITWAQWQNNTGTPISSFVTKWIVPDPPQTTSGQLIYLFNGLENSTFILQPVLQWGDHSPAGGGEHWSIASWWVSGQEDFAGHTDLVDVKPGDELIGVMERVAPPLPGPLFAYTCSFKGIPKTKLLVFADEELTWSFQTLECYGLKKPSDYPSSFDTVMGSISLTTGDVHPPIAWTPIDKVTDCGQHTSVVSDSSHDGEVKIFYRDDILPGDPVAAGIWSSITAGHTLIAMHDGKVLDWVPADGSWRLWNYDPSNKADILGGAPVAQGTWKSIREGHTLVPMHDGKVLDWVPANGSWRLWNYDPSNKADVLHGDPVSQGTWKSIFSLHTLIPMIDGNVLDVFEGGQATWRLWKYDPKNVSDILPGPPLAQGTWSSIGLGHTLLAMHDGKVLDWVRGDGTWRLWKYDPTSKSDVLPGNPIAVGQWQTVGSSDNLIVMNDGKVLDTTPIAGSATSWRLWNYVPSGG